MNREGYKPVEMDPRYRLVINYYLMCHNKKDALKKAGFSPHSVREVFGRPEVRAEIERRVKLAEYKTDLNKDWLIQKLVDILDSDQPIEVDKKGRPFLNLNNLSGDTRRIMGKLVINEKDKKVKYSRTERETQYVSLTPMERIACIKELGILLGYRVEQNRMELDDSLVDKLTKRRQELANGGLPSDGGGSSSVDGGLSVPEQRDSEEEPVS